MMMIQMIMITMTADLLAICDEDHGDDDDDDDDDMAMMMMTTLIE